MSSLLHPFVNFNRTLMSSSKINRHRWNWKKEVGGGETGVERKRRNQERDILYFSISLSRFSFVSSVPLNYWAAKKFKIRSQTQTKCQRIRNAIKKYIKVFYTKTKKDSRLGMIRKIIRKSSHMIRKIFFFFKFEEIKQKKISNKFFVQVLSQVQSGTTTGTTEKKPEMSFWIEKSCKGKLKKKLIRITSSFYRIFIYIKKQ